MLCGNLDFEFWFRLLTTFAPRGKRVWKSCAFHIPIGIRTSYRLCPIRSFPLPETMVHDWSSLRNKGLIVSVDSCSVKTSGFQIFNLVRKMDRFPQPCMCVHTHSANCWMLISDRKPKFFRLQQGYCAFRQLISLNSKKGSGLIPCTSRQLISHSLSFTAAVAITLWRSCLFSPPKRWEAWPQKPQFPHRWEACSGE